MLQTDYSKTEMSVMSNIKKTYNHDKKYQVTIIRLQYNTKKP